MKLKELLNIIDDYQDFQLFKGDRIGRFNKKDKRLEPYFNEEVWNIQVEDEVFEIKAAHAPLSYPSVSSNLYPTPQTVLSDHFGETPSSFSRRRLTCTSTVRLSPK